MARSRLYRSHKASLTSSKEAVGVATHDTAIIRAGGSGSPERVLTRQHFLSRDTMNEAFNEKVNIPIAFEIDPTDPDDDIWPKAQSALPERGVVLLGHNGGTSEGFARDRNPHNKVEWNQETIHESIRICREKGFVPGAIVAARPLLGSGNDWKVKSYVYWGIVTALNTYIPGQTYLAYAPLMIRWFVPTNHYNRTEDRLFPSDLYLIHAALTEGTITNKMLEQQHV